MKPQPLFSIHSSNGKILIEPQSGLVIDQEEWYANTGIGIIRFDMIQYRSGYPNANPNTDHADILDLGYTWYDYDSDTFQYEHPIPKEER